MTTPAVFQVYPEDSLPELEELFNVTYGALLRHARRMLRSFPVVKQWDDTDDVWQAVAQRLWEYFRAHPPKSYREFYAFSCQRIRWHLLDLARKYEIRSKRIDSQSSLDEIRCRANCDVVSLSSWTEFHHQVGLLPVATREVFCLVWYFELSYSEAARVLNVAPATVGRRWREARHRLAPVIPQVSIG